MQNSRDLTNKGNCSQAPPLWTYKETKKWIFQSAITDSNEPTGFLYAFTWSSPIFDLRPDLLSAANNTRQGIPIWNISSRLRIGLQGENGGTFDGANLFILAQEYVSIFDANVQTAPGFTASPSLFALRRVNVTSSFFPTNTAPGVGNVLGGITPRGGDLGGGEGYPVRYWRCELRFQLLVNEDLPLPTTLTEPDPIVLTAGMY